MKAIWNNQVIACSEDTVLVEGNHYFPVDSLVTEHFQPSVLSTSCPWKGAANYYDVVVGENVNRNAAWFYPSPKPEAEAIRNRVAFWKGVLVEA